MNQTIFIGIHSSLRLLVIFYYVIFQLSCTKVIDSNNPQNTLNGNKKVSSSYNPDNRVDLASLNPDAVLSYESKGSQQYTLGSEVYSTLIEDKQLQETVPIYKQPVASLGQPLQIKPYFGISILLDKEENDTDLGGNAYLGLYRDLVNPVTGLIGISAETYLAGTSDSELIGMRLLASSPVFHLHAGLDYEIVRNDADLILSITPPLKRGGLFGKGDFFRIDWLPTRSNSFLFGIQIPLFQKTGKTRPRDRKVTLPRPKERLYSDENVLADTEIAKELSNMSRAAKWMIDYNLFYEDTSRSFDKSLQRTNEAIDLAVMSIKIKDQVYPNGKTFDAISKVYHKHLDNLFRNYINVDEDSKDALLNAVRIILLEDIIIPYDRTIGQIRRYDSLIGFGEIAKKNLSSWIDNNLNIDAKNKSKALNLFNQVILVLEETRKHSLYKCRGDNRQVWLLYQYALLPHEHDSREEIDNLIEKTISESFSERNAVVALDTNDFIRQLKRTIEVANDYHVLWVHDYRGIDSNNNPDEVGFDISINNYMEILTQRVKEYDKVGKIPVYMIFIDQYFYESRKGRLWLTLLENPLEHEMKFPKKFEYMRKKVKESQLKLINAVSNSKLLTKESAEFGNQYIKNKIKVHVNVGQPPDFSFLSPGLVKGFPMLPDNVMIDHKKLVFYDITEADPYRGEAIFTGAGIGKHYSTPTWDDRSMLVSGPAVVKLRQIARNHLIRNGLNEIDIPEVLKENYKSGNTTSVTRSKSLASDARAITIENSIGYGDKYSTLVFSILYSLVPTDTTIVLPDSLWLSEYWAGLVIGAAARGCHVYVIAPSADNAPSPGSTRMWRSIVLLSKLLAIRNRAADILEMNSGVLRVGIYNRQSDVGNVVEVLRETVNRYNKYDFLREEFPVDDSTLEIILDIADQLEEENYQPIPPAEDIKKRLVNIHRKTRFLASKDILSKLVTILNTQRDLRGAMDIYVRSSLEVNPEDVFNNKVLQVMHPIIKDYNILKNKGFFTNDILYYSVGSQNHDPRGMMLDGEISLLISGPWALWGYIDSMYTFGLVDWVETQEELEGYLPMESNWKRNFSYWIRNLL